MICGCTCRDERARRLSFGVAIWLALLAGILPNALSAQQDERSVRVAFVYNLTKYVAWPANTRELNICVFGGGATGSALKLVVDGKISEGRMIHVLLEPREGELRHCEIAYWSTAARSTMRSILDKSRGSSVLTVGEDDRFVREGGMLGFVRSGDSIQIEVNLDSVKAGGLTVSSRLLDLARIVSTGKRS